MNGLLCTALLNRVAFIIMQTFLSPVNLAASVSKASGADPRIPASLQPRLSEPVAEAGEIHQRLGLEASRDFDNVSAETATALHRTVLQSLAQAIAARMGVRQNAGELFSLFLLRLGDALANLPRNGAPENNISRALKLFDISLDEFRAAVSDPDGAMAARIAAKVEAPASTARGAATATVTANYLATAHEEIIRGSGRGSTMPHDLPRESPLAQAGLARPEDRQINPRILQERLRTIFESGAQEPTVALQEETHAATLEKAGKAMARLFDHFESAAPGAGSPRAPNMPEQAMAGRADPPQEALAEDANPREDGQVATFARSQTAGRAAEQLSHSGRMTNASLLDRPVETMLALKGYSEVSSLAEPEPAPAMKGRPDRLEAGSVFRLDQIAVQTGEPAKPFEQSRDRDAAISEEPLTGKYDDDVEPLATRRDDQRSTSVRSEQRHGNEVLPALAETLKDPEAVPFGYVVAAPARDARSKAGAADEEQDRPGNGREDRESKGEDNHEHAERENVEEAETGDESDSGLKLTRDSTDADRAYFMYQKLGGF